MTKKETELLGIAKLIMGMNPHLNLAITGSLMLSLLKIDIGREAGDLDLISKEPLDKINMPDGYRQTRGGYATSTFISDSGFKVDIMNSGDDTCNLDGVSIGNISQLIQAKKNFITKLSGMKQVKHIQDIHLIISIIDPMGHLGFRELLDRDRKANSVWTA